VLRDASEVDAVEFSLENVFHMYYTEGMWGDLDWSVRGDYIVEKHGITPREAQDAISDPQRLVFEPDYNSQSGRSVRIVGHSVLAGKLLTVIALRFDGIEYGVNAWESNPRDRSIYSEKGEAHG